MERAEKIIALWLLLAVGVCAQTADVLIVEKPQALRLLNRYEQSLGESEMARLYSFMPFEILRPQVILSDGFTTAMKVRNGADDYFILTESPGKPINLSSAGGVKMFYQTWSLNDTVLIQRSIDVSQGIEPGKIHAGVIGQNAPAVRFFKAGSWTYLRTLIGTGWAQIGSEDFTTLRAPSSQKQPIDVESLLHAILDQSNTVLRNLFVALNRRNGTHKSIPQWQLQKNHKKIICTLTPSGLPHAFTETNRQLQREIANALLGIPCKTQLTDSGIEIIIY